MMNENKKPIKDESTIPKDWIKSYILNYVDNEIMYMKEIRRGKNSFIFDYIFWHEIIGIKEDAKKN